MAIDSLSSLFERPVWVAWRSRDGRKVPMSPHGGYASTVDPSTWGTYAEASALAEARGYSGVGIMLADGLTGIDLDHVIDGSGEMRGWARAIVEEVGGYAEYSPSGTGVHILAYADPGRLGLTRNADHRKGIEVYNSARYFTVTGNQIGTGAPVDRTERIAAVLARELPARHPARSVADAARSIARDQSRRRANETMRENAARDGVRYARVPMGGETCGFCLMLASRGFVYGTEKTAGEGNHYHADCRCKVVPGFEGTEVEGYDPDALYGLYAEARANIGGVSDDVAISREIEAILAKRDGDAISWAAQGESGISRKRNADISAGVDFNKVNSTEYADAFKGPTGNAATDDAVLRYARAALSHRTGTSSEDLFLVSIADGGLVAKQTSSVTHLSVDPSEDIDKAVANAPRGSLFAIHNHPSNVPPTGSDLVTSGARGYGGAIVVLHNGGVYYYRHGESPFTAGAFDMVVDRNRKNGDSDIDAFEKALAEFEGRFGISWRRIV